MLRASATPGQVDVDLNVQDSLPLHATLEVNNRYSANTAELRLIGEVSYDNLIQSNQSLSIQYQTAPQDSAEAKIWSVSYVIPTQSGLVWALYAVRSDSNIAAVGDLDVIGDGSIYGLRLIDPLPSSNPSFYHNFTAGIDYKDFKLLQRFVSERGKIVPSRITAVSAKKQRELAQAIKRARFLGLLPYVIR